MAYNKYKGNSKDEDFTVVIDDSNFEQNPKNQGSNHDNVSLVILSDLEPTIKTGNDGGNEDRIPSAIDDEENSVSVPQQRNVPKTESKPSGTFHWLRSKLGLVGPDDPDGLDGPEVPEAEGPDGHDDPKDPEKQQVPKKPDEPEADIFHDKDKQLVEWKNVLKTIQTHKKEEDVRGQVDKFLSSNKLQRLE